jgi:uncharacterized membrane protein HdeD (DUF308 family)
MARAKSEFKKLTDRIWKMTIFQGVAFIIFGIVALFWPGATMAWLIALIGVFILALGIIGSIWNIITISDIDLGWMELIFNIFAISIGIFLLSNPAITANVLIVLIGIVLVTHGVIDLIRATFSHSDDVCEIRSFHIIGGILSILTGIVVFNYPVASGLTFMMIIGIYALVKGTLAITLSIRTRNLLKK